MNQKKFKLAICHKMHRICNVKCGSPDVFSTSPWASSTQGPVPAKASHFLDRPKHIKTQSFRTFGWKNPMKTRHLFFQDENKPKKKLPGLNWLCFFLLINPSLWLSDLHLLDRLRGQRSGHSDRQNWHHVFFFSKFSGTPLNSTFVSLAPPWVAPKM